MTNSREVNPENELEKNLRKINEINKELEKVIIKIEQYHKDVQNKSIGPKEVAKEIYLKDLATRDNLSTQLNYYQNQAIIEQNSHIIKYLKELKK